MLDADSFDLAIERLTEASGGMLSVMLVDRAGAMTMQRAARRGDELALAYLRVLNTYVESLTERRSRLETDLCLCCDREFYRKKKPLIIVVAVPDREVPETCLVTGVCGKCADVADWPRPGWESRLAERMQSVFRKLWPECRLIATTAVSQVAGTA